MKLDTGECEADEVARDLVSISHREDAMTSQSLVRAEVAHSSDDFNERIDWQRRRLGS